ncbi:hypothetical protein GY45DRAFT_848903 [Cubamyces sp. BRFM 1775]|nr:hypothetical protein GY45DRAFT_848903 [Cubamyces sp. BRFM 1775]
MHVLCRLCALARTAIYHITPSFATTRQIAAQNSSAHAIHMASLDLILLVKSPIECCEGPHSLVSSKAGDYCKCTAQLISVRRTRGRLNQRLALRLFPT